MKKPYKKWLFPLLSLVCLGILAFILIQMRIWSLSRDHRVNREEAQPAQVHAQDGNLPGHRTIQGGKHRSIASQDKKKIHAGVPRRHGGNGKQA